MSANIFYPPSPTSRVVAAVENVVASLLIVVVVAKLTALPDDIKLLTVEVTLLTEGFVAVLPVAKDKGIVAVDALAFVSVEVETDDLFLLIMVDE